MIRAPWLANSIRFAYLASMGLAFFAFFSHLVLDMPIITWLIAGLLVVALVLHEFMQTQRTTIMWGRFFRDWFDKQPVKADLAHAMFNTVFLVCLLVFDVLMMWNYVTMKDTGHFPFPILELDTLQALLIPLLGLAASFMIEVEDRAKDVLAHTANEMLFQTTKKASRQHQKRMKKVAKNGGNLAPIMTSLLVQSGEQDSADLLATIEKGLTVAEHGDLSKLPELYLSGSQKPSGPKRSVVDNRNGLAVQTPFGSPIGSAAGGAELAQSSGRVDSKKGSPKGGRKPRSIIKLPPRVRAANYIRKNPTASLSQIVDGAGVSKQIAVEVRREILGDSPEQTGTEG